MIYLDTALTNLANAFNDIQLLLTAFAYVAGLIMVARAIMMLKAFGQHITQMSSRGEVAGPIVYLIVGAILLYLPSTLDVSLNTVFGTGADNLQGANDLLAYASVTADDKWRRILDIIVKYTKLVGLIAFLRGWFIMAKMGDPGVQPGSMAKGLTHLAAGVLLMNIVGTFKLLGNTLGYST